MGCPIVYAELEIPYDDTTSMSVSLCHNDMPNLKPNSNYAVGYFLAAPNTDSSYVGAPHLWAVNLNLLPLSIGNKPGDTLIMGRGSRTHNGFTENDPVALRIDSGEITDAFSGPYASRKHAEFRVTPNGIIIKDTSTHGTRVTYLR